MTSAEIQIASKDVFIKGDLTLPKDPCGAVLFAHGSGSGRKSSRNRSVAASLNARRLATLLIDLLTEEEEDAERFSAHLRFDIALLADRLRSATGFLAKNENTAGLPLGYFGASTGAGAALVAAADNPHVKAIVSRGGRPDLAGAALHQVKAPTLLLVGSLDQVVIGLNQKALDELRCEKQLTIVPGASHLFEEPGKLDEVARLAGEWFVRWLCA
ncbi:MAG TPA: dienelactone hydrolase family protein [Fimbriimonas sp.]|nr:dienelactone hydrolase family protein [Fimbriimonas sp.]